MLNEVDPAANRSTANGSTTVFAYTFEIARKEDIEVLVDLVVKTVDTDYTVDGIGNSGGGNVTFISAPANATTVTRLRKQPGSQLSDHVSNTYNAELIEADLDKLAMQIQQVRETLHRGFFLPKSSALVDQGIDVPEVGRFARGKSGGGIDWATPTNAGPLSSPVAIADGGTGATTAAGARTNLLVYSENTLVDAKGDLLIGASDNTLARLAPPATTGFVPTYDPSATNFISWGPRAQQNPIINGNMEVWQRGTTFAAAANGTYTADRWRWGQSGAGVVTVQRSTNTPGFGLGFGQFNYSLEVSVTTADAAIAVGDLYVISQRIEGHNWKHFAGRQFTVSFWAMSSKTGVHCMAFRNNASATPDRSYVAEYTITTPNFWEYKTVTVTASPGLGTWDYTTGAGLEIAFVIAAGSTFHTTANAWQTGNFYATANQVNAMDLNTNFFRIMGVKLELGSVATPIQFRSFQEELALCIRYYQKSFPYATAPAQNAGDAGADVLLAPFTGTTQVSIPVTFQSRMRVAPTSVTTYNPGAANAQARNTTDAADDNTTGIATTERGLFITFAPNATNTVSDVHRVQWSADAEL